MISEEFYNIIPAGTPFAVALRQIFIDCANETISDEEVQSTLITVRDIIIAEDTGL